MTRPFLSRLAAPLLLVAAVLLWPLSALAQEVAEVATGSAGPFPPNVWWGNVANAVLGALLLALGAVLVKAIHFAGRALADWLEAKAAGTKHENSLRALAAFTRKAETLAADAIGYVDAHTMRERQEAMADGVLEPAEIKALQDLALKKFLEFMGQRAPSEFAGIMGTAAPLFEEWARGLIQRVFNAKKIAETAAEPPVVNYAAPSPTVDAKGAVVASPL